MRTSHNLCPGRPGWSTQHRKKRLIEMLLGPRWFRLLCPGREKGYCATRLSLGTAKSSMTRSPDWSSRCAGSRHWSIRSCYGIKLAQESPCLKAHRFSKLSMKFRTTGNLTFKKRWLRKLWSVSPASTSCFLSRLFTKASLQPKSNGRM